VLTLPSMALAGASPALELVLAVAVQPVSGSAVSVAARADALDVTAWPTTGARPPKAASTAAVPAASHARRRAGSLLGP
jgi:hypothetical protein